MLETISYSLSLRHMKNFQPIFLLLFWIFCLPLSNGQDVHLENLPKLENPISASYLKEHLEKKAPRLMLNTQIEKALRLKLKSDPVLQNVFQAMENNVEMILKDPILERTMRGRRLLRVSREMLYRMNVLGMVYRMKKDKKILNRIDREVQAVCQFQDWNPSHFLDVAEMSLAVALAVDWVGEDLPKTTTQLAKRSLIEKGLQPSFANNGNNSWVDRSNNWNQVCHGGLIGAALVIADEDPELAAKTISRALDNMHYALGEYGPDGVYPEGSTYWEYGTMYTVMTAAMFESAFGQDFGLAQYPAFQESATFRLLSKTPSDWYYNFADCGDRRNPNGDMTLAWFAAKTGNPNFYEKERFLREPTKMGKLPRYAGAALVWMSQYEEGTAMESPKVWKGGGANPISIFYDQNDPNGFYLGAKGGRGTVNHGNMDAGSFIFELNGVRWVVDPGNQAYHDLEKTGFNLWGRCQDCERWTLLTKNNFGHSTLTVNDELHVVDGLATISEFEEGQQPKVSFELSPTFKGQLNRAQRSFQKLGPQSLLIEDQIETLESTQQITWQLMTRAEVELQKGGAVLHQNGKQLKVEILSHPGLFFSVIMLDPPPLELDRNIKGLKRLEIRYPAYLFPNRKGRIKVRLSAD